MRLPPRHSTMDSPPRDCHAPLHPPAAAPFVYQRHSFPAASLSPHPSDTVIPPLCPPRLGAIVFPPRHRPFQPGPSRHALAFLPPHKYAGRYAHCPHAPHRCPPRCFTIVPLPLYNCPPRRSAIDPSPLIVTRSLYLHVSIVSPPRRRPVARAAMPPSRVIAPPLLFHCRRVIAPPQLAIAPHVFSKLGVWMCWVSNSPLAP